MKTTTVKTTTMKTLLLSGLIGLGMPFATAQDSFGSGANAFTMDFVNVGNAGNLDDSGTTGAYHTAHGGVAYDFRMGTYEVSEDMITKANTLGGLGISQNGRGANKANKPAGSVSWNEAARFVNWLNTSKGHSAAYKFALQPGDVGYSSNANLVLWEPGDAGYDVNNLYRNANALYVLPSEDEWYKAAYYSGAGSTYFDYATQQDSPSTPTAVSGGTGANDAVYGQSPATEPADITNAGGLSFYDTMGQNGNVWEWNESAFDGVNNLTDEERGVRGGYGANSESSLRSSIRFDFSPAFEYYGFGFRVVSIPEPSTLILTMILLGTSLLIKRRKSSL